MYCVLQMSLACFLATVVSSSAEVEFEGRWITRPPADKEFPHAVYIVMSRAADGTCSGSLVAQNWVVTAARCMYGGDRNVVENDTSLTVYAGLDNKLEAPYVQKRTSVQMVIHDVPGKDNYFSVALIKVRPSFIGSYKGKKVIPLETLVPEGSWKNGTEATCKSGSYGRIEWDKEQPPALKKTLAMITDCNCSSAITNAFPNSDVDQWLCGENEYNLGICKGDFGATLQCDFGPSMDWENLIAMPIDIITFTDQKSCTIVEKESKKCTDVHSVGVYLNLCFHLEWMQRHVSVLANTTSCVDKSLASKVCINFHTYSALSLLTFLFTFFDRYTIPIGNVSPE